MLTLKINEAILEREPYASMPERAKRNLVFHIDEPSFNLANMPLPPNDFAQKTTEGGAYVPGQNSIRSLFVTHTGIQLNESVLTNLTFEGCGTFYANIAEYIRRGLIIMTNSAGRTITPEDVYAKNFA